MAKIVAIVNQKGGVGKTTTCVNLAAALKAAGQRVLLCDFDPQANATSGMGVDKTVSNGIYDVLINGVATENAIVRTPYGDVLPSSKALAGAGVELIGMDGAAVSADGWRWNRCADNYDFMFIDCPPSLELLTLNALCAADSLLVPVQGEYYALEGLTDLMNTVRHGAAEPEPQAGDRGCAADHVRRAHQSGHSGGAGGEALLPRQGLCHGDPPERAALARHPATESPSPPMTAPAGALRPICSWRRSF